MTCSASGVSGSPSGFPFDPIAVQHHKIASGIPPHVAILQEMAGNRSETPRLWMELSTDLLISIEKLIRRLVEDGAVSRDQVTPQYLFETLKACLLTTLQEQGLTTAVSTMSMWIANHNGALPGSMSASGSAATSGHHHPAQGASDAGNAATFVLPKDFKLSAFGVAAAWQSYVCGSGPSKPYRFLVDTGAMTHNRDIYKYNSLMEAIRRRVEARGKWKGGTISIGEAAEMYAEVRSDFEVEGTKHKRRHRELSWRTVHKNYMQESAKRRKLSKCAHEESTTSDEGDSEGS